jgi:ubiquinone/menaquinone biosynthesis C-methylase UbiE
MIPIGPRLSKKSITFCTGGRISTSLLDLGCGIGRHAMLFARHGFYVTALDLSPSGLKKLSDSARGLKPSIRTVLADVMSLPLNDASFDAVISYHSIYHLFIMSIRRGWSAPWGRSAG